MNTLMKKVRHILLICLMPMIAMVVIVLTLGIGALLNLRKGLNDILVKPRVNTSRRYYIGLL